MLLQQHSTTNVATVQLSPALLEVQVCVPRSLLGGRKLGPELGRAWIRLWIKPGAREKEKPEKKEKKVQ